MYTGCTTPLNLLSTKSFEVHFWINKLHEKICKRVEWNNDSLFGTLYLWNYKELMVLTTMNSIKYTIFRQRIEKHY